MNTTDESTEVISSPPTVEIVDFGGRCNHVKSDDHLKLH